jgi:hypothetical protein
MGDTIVVEYTEGHLSFTRKGKALAYHSVPANV